MRLIMTGLMASTLVACAGIGMAQDQPVQHQGSAMAAMELPEACREKPAPADGMSGMMLGMEGMADHNRALVQRMMETHAPMMQGMMADDPDIAFACGMIPHHQAAIMMAEAELQNGDDEQMQQMAQTIIDAQKKEIDELTIWIAEKSK